MLSRNSNHTSNTEGGLGRVQPRDKLRRVARVRAHQRSVISRVRRGQREERLVRLVRGNGRDASGPEAGLGRLCLTAVQVGGAVGAAVAAVCAGADVAEAGTVRAVRRSLAPFSVLFAVVAVAAVADGTALLVRRLAARTVRVRRGLPGRRATPFVSRQLLLLLSMSGGAAAVDPGAGGSVLRRIGLVTRGRASIGAGASARQPEARFIVAAAAAAAAGVAADNAVPTTLSAPFVVRFEAAFAQGGRRRSAVGLLVSLTAGGAQPGGRGIWFSDLRAGLGQEGQRTLLGVQLRQNTDCDELCGYFETLEKVKFLSKYFLLTKVVFYKAATY